MKSDKIIRCRKTGKPCTAYKCKDYGSISGQTIYCLSNNMITSSVRALKAKKAKMPEAICIKCRKVYPKCKIRRRCWVIQCDDFLPFAKGWIR